MSNPRRGDHTISVDGKDYALRLTMNSLAEIESLLGVKTLDEFTDRFQQLGIRDIKRILSCLIAGAGGVGSVVDDWPVCVGEYLSAIIATFKAGGFYSDNAGNEDKKK